MNTWGDGIYVGRRWGLINDDTPTDITISEPTVLNAGRNGISLSAGTRVNILMPYVFGVKGKAPEAGIDIEPEAADGLPKSHLKDCIITSPTIENCKLGLVGYFFQMILHMNWRFQVSQLLRVVNSLWCFVQVEQIIKVTLILIR